MSWWELAPVLSRMQELGWAREKQPLPDFPQPSCSTHTSSEVSPPRGRLALWAKLQTPKAEDYCPEASYLALNFLFVHSPATYFTEINFITHVLYDELRWGGKDRLFSSPPEQLFCDRWISVLQAVWSYFCLPKKKHSTWILTLLMHLSLLWVASTPFNLLLDFWFWWHRQRWTNSLIPTVSPPSSYTLISRKESKKLS